jgi:hypothetical protein
MSEPLLLSSCPPITTNVPRGCLGPFSLRLENVRRRVRRRTRQRGRQSGPEGVFKIRELFD